MGPSTVPGGIPHCIFNGLLRGVTKMKCQRCSKNSSKDQNLAGVAGPTGQQWVPAKKKKAPSAKTTKQ
ncbi:hypothetical protein HHI36_023727 [Cryptolaemus montrouzieri]|uniref:Uncharacterized protein n=1 Tax=Cryptolaemus montrouzieri TaxID=559131 RepID=A0ABD2PHB9_9CUCU